MSSLENKMDLFTKTALSSAIAEKDNIISTAQNKRLDLIDAAENKALEEAYNYIQTELVKINKDKNVLVLKKQADMKNHLLKQRENMIEQVFNEVKEKITDFISTNEYKEYLFSCIDEAIIATGEGEKIVTISKNDEKYTCDIKDKYKNATVEIAINDILGGVIIKNLSMGVVSDQSMKRALEELKSGFLAYSKLVISNNN